MNIIFEIGNFYMLNVAQFWTMKAIVEISKNFTAFLTYANHFFSSMHEKMLVWRHVSQGLPNGWTISTKLDTTINF